MFLNFKILKIMYFYKQLIFILFCFDLLHEYCSILFRRLCADQFCYIICLYKFNEKIY